MQGAKNVGKRVEFVSDRLSLVEGQVTGSCKRGNEPSDSIKCVDFYDWLRSG
jgi:hypothetical protein